MLREGKDVKSALKSKWTVRKKPGKGHTTYIDIDSNGTWIKVSFYYDDAGTKALRVANHIADLHNASLVDKT